MNVDDHQIHMKGGDHKIVGHSLEINGNQALSWYSNNFSLPKPDKFQFLNITPRKVDRDKNVQR